MKTRNVRTLRVIVLYGRVVNVNLIGDDLGSRRVELCQLQVCRHSDGIPLSVFRDDIVAAIVLGYLGGYMGVVNRDGICADERLVLGDKGAERGFGYGDADAMGLSGVIGVFDTPGVIHHKMIAIFLHQNWSASAFLQG